MAALSSIIMIFTTFGMHTLQEVVGGTRVAVLSEREQQRVAVGPENAHCMFIHQVSLRVALAGSVLWPAAAAAPAATAALLLLLMLLL